MVRNWKGLLSALLISGLVGPSGAAPDPETLADMEAIVRGFVEKGWVVGAEFMVLHEGEVLSHVCAGWRDRETERPMAPHSIFNIRSMTKPLVGSITQRLMDRGLLASGDPVSRYLPAFGTGAAADITIEHLLTHRSGLRDGNPEGRPSDFPTLRSIADYWGKAGPTLCAPGAEFHYSDPGADVLAATLEVVTGLPLPELARQELFAPLSMADSHALIDRQLSADPRFVSIYRPDGAGDWRRVWQPGDGSIVPFAIGSGTTWYATPADYARLLRAWMADGLLSTGRWLSNAAVSRALAPRSRMTEYSSAVPGTEVRYGQMWQVYVDGSAEDAPLRLFGHSGSDGTYAWAWPAEDLIVLYFTQSRGQRTRLLLEQQFDVLSRQEKPRGSHQR